MTENVGSPGEPDGVVEPSADATDAPEPVAEATGPGGDDSDHSGDPKWRARYRQAEARLTVEQARIATINQRDAEQQAAVALQDPADLFRDGIDINDLLGDDGLIDKQKVDDAAAEVVAAHPHWARSKPVHGVPASAVAEGAGPISDPQPTSSWDKLLKGQAG